MKSLLTAAYLFSSLQGPAIVQKSIDSHGNSQIESSQTVPQKLVMKSNHQNLRIAILGDSGCRVRGAEVQNCFDELTWPLSSITRSIANETPDIVIHVGDYHYRVSCRNSALCPRLEPTLGYTWKAWEADWFAPAQPILHIPTLYIRGNHENCRRAWEHWQMYLSASTPTSTSSPHHECQKKEPYSITEIGPLILVNFDSNWISDEFPKNGETPSDQTEMNEDLILLKKELLKINPRRAKDVFLITHKPVYGLVPYSTKDNQNNTKESYIWDVVTPRLTAAIESSGLDEVVDLYISGHIHNGQLVQGSHPLQIVAGEGGAHLEPVGDFAYDLVAARNGSFGYIPTQEKHQFGYIILEQTKNAKSFIIDFKTPQGLNEARCFLQGRIFNCRR